MVLRAVRRTLAREHDVVCEERARAALARLSAGERFDLLVCDLMMPDLSGAELHAALRAARPDLADRMVFLTGGAFSPTARAFLASVANACLEKPFEPDAFRARIRELLGRAG
jgi:CheY-like chemotaxis protein